MKVVTLEACHLGAINVQPAQAEEFAMQGGSVPPGGGWAFLDGDDVLAAYGLATKWPGVAYAWALLSADAGRHMVALTRAIRAELDAAEFGRVEMAVDAGFPEAVRFARVLGFRCETPEPMQRYFPNGHAAYLYARVKDELVSASLRRVDAGAKPARPSAPV